MSRIFRNEPYIPKAKDARKKKMNGTVLVVSVLALYGGVGYWWYTDGSWWVTHWFENLHVKFGGVDISPKDIPHL